MFNQVQLIGNLGKDPEVRTLNDGTKVCNFSVATAERWNDKSTGEKKEKTEWHNIVVWGKLAEICGQYLTKGSKVFIQGQLETRKWQDKSGADRYSTEVVLRMNGVMKMLGDKTGGSKSDGTSDERQISSGGSRSQTQDMDDEIPF